MHNANDLITQITDNVNAARTQAYSYDELSRITTVQYPNASIADTGNGVTAVTYDANGNRLGWDGVTYTIAANSNRLTGTNALAPSSMTHDGAGNTLTYSSSAWGAVYYQYNAFNQMQSTQLNSSTVGTYGYNGYGERSSKIAGANRDRFVYTDDQRLLAERRDAGSAWTNYLWFGGELVGITRGSQRYFLHNDHLGRPELATNVSKQAVWKAENRTFGESRPPSIVLDSIGGLNVGFPGQYFDAESGLWYNLNRYYDGLMGRYTQVDPIGLGSGVNTYSYVGGNPVSLIDPLGLDGVGYWNNGQQHTATPWNQRSDFIQASVSLYVFSASVSLSRSGAVYGSAGFSRDYPAPNLGLGVSFNSGVLLNDCPTRDEQAQAADDMLKGLSYSASVHAGIGGGIGYSPGSGAAATFGFGAGVQVSPGSVGTPLFSTGWGW